MSATETSRFWRPESLDGAELIHTSCGRHAFPRHFHEEYTIAIWSGASSVCATNAAVP
jgi:hypothetical protein